MTVPRPPFRFGIVTMEAAPVMLLEVIGALPDLYDDTNGSIRLRIENGDLDVRSLQVAGLGVVDLPDLDIGIPEADWRFEMLEKNT